MPTADLARFKQRSDDLVACFNSPDPHAPDAIRAELDAYFQVSIDERRAMLSAAGVEEPGEEHLATVVPHDLISDYS